MKILWVKTDFLHPANKGGQIRTLETLRRLHRRHEIDYVAFAGEGAARAGEYCSRAWPVVHRLASKKSAAFAVELAANLASRLPAAVARYRSAEMRRRVDALRRERRYDAIVCDFLAPAPNIAGIEECVLFQHNVESAIWRRHAAHAADPLRRAYFGLQAARMERYEGEICRRARHVIAVSAEDAETMRRGFGVERVSHVPTGVDVDYFRPPLERHTGPDLVFVGSMDWLPNADAAVYFAREILPRIRRRRPDCSVAFVGRDPGRAVRALEPGVFVTGTVADVRPWLWGAKVSIVPLRIGGGTRLKIYEAMASHTPVVSTTVGAEGLTVAAGHDILIADDPEEFARSCVYLLDHPGERERIASAAQAMVSANFSWDRVASRFEAILEAVGQAAPCGGLQPARA